MLRTPAPPAPPNSSMGEQMDGSCWDLNHPIIIARSSTQWYFSICLKFLLLQRISSSISCPTRKSFIRVGSTPTLSCEAESTRCFLAGRSKLHSLLVEHGTPNNVHQSSHSSPSKTEKNVQDEHMQLTNTTLPHFTPLANIGSTHLCCTTCSQHLDPKWQHLFTTIYVCDRVDQLPLLLHNRG